MTTKVPLGDIGYISIKNLELRDGSLAQLSRLWKMVIDNAYIMMGMLKI